MGKADPVRLFDFRKTYRCGIKEAMWLAPCSSATGSRERISLENDCQSRELSELDSQGCGQGVEEEGLVEKSSGLQKAPGFVCGPCPGRRGTW